MPAAKRYLGYAVRYGVPAVRSAVRAYNNMRSNRTTSRGATRSTMPVSFQHDFSTQYRRKRAPRRVRRRQKRATRQFRYQIGKSLGQFSRVFNFVYAPATITPTSLATSQTIKDVCLYGGSQTDATDGTLLRIAADLGLWGSTSKILFKSAVLDVQIRNVDTDSPLIVDAYKVVARREGYDSPGLEFSQALVNQVIMAGSSNMTGFQMGVTPFDAPGFGSKWLITGKTRYRIGAGNSIYLQMRDAKNYEFDTARFDYDPGAAVSRVQMFKGMTKGWLFIARSSSLDATNAYSGEINWQMTINMNYHYTVLKEEFDNKGAN